jgi:hypothetical protein
MALLAAQSPTRGGVTLTFSAAAGGGDTVRCGDRVYLIVRNGDASSKTVTVDVPGLTAVGAAQPDASVVIAAGAQAIIGPIDAVFAQPGTSPATANITYSAVTSVTVAVIS